MSVQVSLGSCTPAPAGPIVAVDNPIKGDGTASNPLDIITGAWAGPGTVDTCGQLLSLDSAGNLRQREEKGSVSAHGGGGAFYNVTVTNAPTPVYTSTPTSVTNPYCGAMTVAVDIAGLELAFVIPSTGIQYAATLVPEFSINGGAFSTFGGSTSNPEIAGTSTGVLNSSWDVASGGFHDIRPLAAGGTLSLVRQAWGISRLATPLAIQASDQHGRLLGVSL